MTMRFASLALSVVMLCCGTTLGVPGTARAQVSGAVEGAPERAAPGGHSSRQSRNREAIAKARATLAARERAQGPEHPSLAAPLQSLATLLRDVAEYREARVLYERALALREKALGPDHPDVAATLNGLGYLLFRMADYTAARPMLERALAIREKAFGPTHVTLGSSLNDLGLLLYTTGDPTAARPLFERALAVREGALGPTHALVSEVTLNLGRLHQDAGDYRAARTLLERTLQIREAALGPTHPMVATALAQLGTLHMQTGDYAAARPRFERALTIREAALGPDHPEVAASMSDLGWALRVTADYPGARARYTRALDIQERRLGPRHPGVAQALYNLAQTERIAGDYAAARPLLERAITIREQAFGTRHPSVATAVSQLGLVHYLRGDFVAARPLYERALAIREATRGPHHREVGDVVNDLGLLLRATGDLRGARRAYERAVRIYEQALGADHVQLAAPLSNLSAVLRQTADYAEARPPVERALKIREQALGPNHPDVATSLNDLGALLQGTRDYAGAQPLFERALRIREQAFGPDHVQVASELNVLGFLFHATGRPAEARPLFERALRIRERVLGPQHVSVAQTLNNLGAGARAVKDYDGAIPFYERALPIVRRVQVPELRWRVTFGLAQSYEGRGRAVDAVPLYQESIAALEAVAARLGDGARRTQYLQAENRLAPYDALARTLLTLHERDSTKGYDREAWTVLDAKKGRVASEALAGARPMPSDPAARQEAERLQAKEQQATALERALREAQETSRPDQASSRIESITTLLAQTKVEYLAQAQTFLARYPQYKAQFVDQQTVDPKALAKFAERLPSGTLVVQYFAAPDRLYLFVVAPGGRFQVKSRAVTQEALYALIKQYRTHVEAAATTRLPWHDDGSSAYREKVLPLHTVTRTLSALLLEPVAAELKTHTNLVVVPNDLLLYLPVHALMLDGARFLAETHQVSYVTQLELADLLTPTAAVTGSMLLALANPDGTLPAASREVRELGRIRQGATMLDGAEATKARFVQLVSQFNDVHLATHGVLDTEHPERSYLLMAGADEGSQRLSVVEIAGLSMARNGLAVLSACETALGEQVPGAALITLAAAFSQAGAQSIVASLWKVNDAATRDFMVTFYRTLASRGRVASLQQAQRTALGDAATAHPYYWAPFILIGAR